MESTHRSSSTGRQKHILTQCQLRLAQTKSTISKFPEGLSGPGSSLNRELDSFEKRITALVQALRGAEDDARELKEAKPVSSSLRSRLPTMRCPYSTTREDSQRIQRRC